MSKVAATVAVVAVLVACETPPAAGANHFSRATATPSATGQPAASPSPQAVGLVKCERFPNQTYSNALFGFSVECPSGFWWETFANSQPGRLWQARTVEDKYKDSYPAGQIEFAVNPFDFATLRPWIDSHTGDPLTAPGHDFWNSVSNVSDITVGGAPAVAFDYVMKGPESPNNFHAVALILQSRYVFVMDWWAYADSGYEPAISNVAKSVIASIKLS